MQVGHVLNLGVALQVEVLLSLQHTLCSSRTEQKTEAGGGSARGSCRAGACGGTAHLACLWVHWCGEPVCCRFN
jgi:hypothetical protein